MNLTTLHVSDVAAKPRNATSPPPGGNEKPIARMVNPRVTDPQMTNMQHTLPGERVLGLLGLSTHSRYYMADSRCPRDPDLLHHLWTDTMYTEIHTSSKTVHTLRTES